MDWPEFQVKVQLATAVSLSLFDFSNRCMVVVVVVQFVGSFDYYGPIVVLTVAMMMMMMGRGS